VLSANCWCAHAVGGAARARTCTGSRIAQEGGLLSLFACTPPPHPGRRRAPRRSCRGRRCVQVGEPSVAQTDCASLCSLGACWASSCARTHTQRSALTHLAPSISQWCQCLHCCRLRRTCERGGRAVLKRRTPCELDEEECADTHGECRVTHMQQQQQQQQDAGCAPLHHFTCRRHRRLRWGLLALQQQEQQQQQPRQRVCGALYAHWDKWELQPVCAARFA